MQKGSLNSNYRKKELKRINLANYQILEQLRRVKPSVGTKLSWRKHEEKMKQIKYSVTLGHTQTMNTMQQPTKNSRERRRIYSRGDLMREGTTGEGPCNGFGGY